MRRLAAFLFLPSCLAVAQLHGPGAGAPQVREECALLDALPRAEVRNTADGRANLLARADTVVMPALALHPPGQGEAEVLFRGVAVPPCAAGQRVLLLVHLGMSDGIPWNDARHPNGVRFAAAVQGQVLLSETLAETGWFPRVVDLTPWAGQDVAIAFRTDAVDGNAAYDWALFGRPRVVLFTPAPAGDLAGVAGAGLALAEVRLQGPARVEVAVGAAATRARLTAGTHVLPVQYSAWGPPEVRCEPTGAATVLAWHSAPWAYAVEAGTPGTDSGFATAGRPFAIVLALRNDSEGTLPAGRELRLRLTRPDGTPLPGAPVEATALTPALAPGEAGIVRWPGWVLPEPGEVQVSAVLGERTQSARIRIYAAEPVLPAARPGRGTVWVAPGAGGWATVANPWCRVTVVLGTGPGDGYAVADVWNDGAWERTASLFPLLRVIAATAGAGRDPLRLELADLREQRGRLVVSGAAVSESGVRWPVRLELAPEARAPRIRVQAELRAPAAGGRLHAFAAPALLPGDGAYGAAREFGLFPGLEYLEGPEPSSSSRDLAPPLHDRRTPSPWKIACPVMAVQGRGALAALAWDPHQEWLPGHRLPAARFVCPVPGTGPEYSHLSLFAPGVGDGTPENADEATSPVDLQPEACVRLACWLVLDHVSRYPAESIVRGPHRGGLIPQAVQHWFDLFGLPEPSKPPRSWSAQRSLSRDAYLSTLWQDDPPGWSLTVGEAPRANAPLAAPLLLDLRAGLAPTTAADVQGRLERVFARSLREEKAIVPVHGNSPVLQYQVGYVPEALQAYVGNARGLLSSRREGLWVWQPPDREHARLGIAGAHTLGQAAYPSLVAVRAALFSGDPDLGRAAVEALRQTERYDVPRGASMWECPQFQPDIFALSLTIKAQCDAFRLTGDPAHLAEARYWAWTGLGFVYTWSLPGYPTMLYNTVGVKGSTFFTHTWIGRPLVWMGLDYAYALQDLADLDDSFDWRRVAAGITASAQWQQYTEGPSRGCYPDSWEQATNRPNPVDINPILIQLNAFRLRGQTADVRVLRVAGTEGPVSLCAGADLAGVRGSPAAGRLAYRLSGLAGWPAYSSLAPVPRPGAVGGAGEECADSAQLAAQPQGWLYHEGTRCLVVKHGPGRWGPRVAIRW